MKHTLLAASLLIVCLTVLPFEASQKSKPAAPSGPVCDRARFFPAPGREAAMVGGKFTGSNVSPDEGFKVLAEIKAAPKAEAWSELTFANDTVYRWLRYEAPAGSHGNVAEIELYSGKQKLAGVGFGSTGERKGRSWRRALDGDVKTWFDSSNADNQFVGLDLGEKATVRRPTLKPGPGASKEGRKVTIECATPDAIVRYTLDGSVPGPDDGLLYTAPLAIAKTTTITAVAFKKGQAASLPTFGTYLVGASDKAGLNTFHVGNSLTNTTNQFPLFARTAGIAHQYRSYTMGGALTRRLWDTGVVGEKERWRTTLAAFKKIDHFTLQPRDFDIAKEAEYDVKFFDLIHKHSPDFQPWLYAEWVEQQRQRPTDKAKVPSSQMKTLYPALTWEESMSAMLLYVEELQLEVAKTYKKGNRPRVIPSAIAMGWIHNLIDQGKVPGVKAGSFYPFLFSDGVHPNNKGGYLVDLTWYAAFYRESPVGKVLPVGTGLTAKQAALMQRLAWDVVSNYPDCGLYLEGKTQVEKPTFSPAVRSVRGSSPVTLSSTTSGAWFRYTLDGTTPTRTKGYLYCGVVSMRPGLTLKAVAFKSGMADSSVAETTYPPEK